MRQKSGKKQSLESPRPNVVHVCVLAEHLLVQKYLSGLMLGEQRLKIVDFNSLRALEEKCIEQVVFVLDRRHLKLPLRILLQQLRTYYTNGACVMIDASLSVENRGWLVSAGIEGFVAYEDVDNTLVDAILSVANGRAWLSSSVLQGSAPRLGGRGVVPSHVSSLTPRELEVLEMLKCRLTNKEIADALSLQETTIRFHVSNILLKLNMNGRHDLSAAKSSERCLGGLSDLLSLAPNDDASNVTSDTVAKPFQGIAKSVAS
jgi:DNA-binding NarL/FixJ family response regulator